MRGSARGDVQTMFFLYGTEAYTMQIANSASVASSSPWIPYTTSLPWTLPGTGEQTVSVNYRSISGDIVGTAEGSINLLPSSSPPSGMTLSQMESLLASLEAELQALKGEASSTTSSPYLFTRNLSLGMTGQDVRALQLFLIAQHIGPAAQKLQAHGATSYFGILTKVALIELQKSVGITPVTPYSCRRFSSEQ